MSGKAVAVTAPHAMVTTGHPLATEVGRRVLQQGGNAIDAAVAVGFALEVVLPSAGNIGGGGFILYRDTTGTVRALDYRETAPGAATRNMYLDAAGNPTAASVTGHLASGVPGSVAGMYEAWKQHGHLPWATLVAPAIALAEGHILDASRSRDIAEDADRLGQFAASRTQFTIDGKPPVPGTTFRQPDLARTLRLIADSGPDVFYRGQIADRIVAEMQRGHGLITKADLAAYHAIWRTPVRIAYRGYTVYSMPPASSGGVTMGEVLNILEGYDSLPSFGTAALVHLETEAMRRAFVDRNRWLGDPGFVQMPLERLLSKSYAATLRSQIDLRRATPTPPFEPGAPGGSNTTHYSIVDAAGNAVAVTTTLNNSFGSAVTVTGAGFLLNDEMDDFAAAPGKPNMYGLVQGEANAIASGKRMLSAMTPTIVLDPQGKLFMVLGAPGGPRIITAVFHVISNVIDHHMPLALAVEAPRAHHQALPDTITLERGGWTPAVLDSLRAMGHGVHEWGYHALVMAIERGAAGWIGVADPRSGGDAAGY
ncbi:MAG TPA: gamma-glutamyltransferase [Gaiellales bacterium]|nr:gamma-glutamyltransferase [Gaiellales bacterium]